MKKKIITILIIIFVFLVSISLIGTGIYINSLSKPENIMRYSLDLLHDEGRKYLFPNDKLYVGDTFTINSSIDFNLDSEYYKRVGQTNVDELKKYNFIKNISKMDTNLLIQQDSKNKTNYISLSEVIGEEDIVRYKRLVDNSTEYYFINGIVKNYVNNGTCNYFETISEENTSKDNLDYLYDYIFESLRKNMKEEYFNTYDVVENIDSKEQNVHQISIKFTNKLIKKILNGVLDDLRSDERSNQILSNTYSDFKKYKVKDIDYFDKNESLTLNIYTTKLLSKPLKYKLVYMKDDAKEEYIVENHDNTLEFFYLKDDNITYTSSIEILENSINSKIYDKSGSEIGEINLERKSNDTSFNYIFDNGEKKIDINYTSKYTDVVNSKKYNNEINLDIKYLVNKESKLSGNILVKNEVINTTKIQEELKSPTLYAKLTKEEKDLIKNKKDKVKERLERY